jgi:uncharacterized protein YcfJ
MASKLIATILAGAALSVAAVPAFAEAQGRHRVLVCKASKHAKNTGTVVGALAGGLLGNAVSSGGGKTGGTLLGAGAGAVVGHQVAKGNSEKKNCHYEYR